MGPLSDGTPRKFLKDGDVVTLRGACTGPHFSVGFGECTGQVLPAGATPPPRAPPPPACALRDVSLQSYWRSSCSWRVRLALAFYGVRHATVPVNLLQGEQAGVGPMAQVPRLSWSDAAGTRHSLTQSLAILAFLSDACDAKGTPSLRPADAVARARACEIAEIIASGTQPLQNLAVVAAVRSAELDGQQLDGRAFGRRAIAKGLAAVESAVAANADRRYCVGAQLSVADVCLVPQLYNARRFDVDLAPFPRLLEVEAHLQTLPPFVAAHPDAQPDAVKA